MPLVYIKLSQTIRDYDMNTVSRLNILMILCYLFFIGHNKTMSMKSKTAQ